MSIWKMETVAKKAAPTRLELNVTLKIDKIASAKHFLSS